MKKGDKVRFLHEIGGGTISGFQGKNIVLVEDEDGFEIPMLMTDVVVVGNEDYSTTNVVNAKAKEQQRLGADSRSVKALMSEGTDAAELGARQAAQSQTDAADEIDYSKVTFRTPVEERKGGNRLSAYLAFVPIDIHEVTHTRFETYFVNDSNYYLRYTYLVAEGNSWTLKASGEVDPNTKEFIEEFGREELNKMERVALQLLAYKREKPFDLKPAIDVQIRIDGVKFYKLHTFQENDFFEQKALLYTIVEQDKVARPLVIDAQRLKAEMYHTEPADKTRVQKPIVYQPRKGDENVLVVDLHASALLDTTAGLSASDILNYQLDKFRKVLAENADKKGKRIVFIHGKGEGVLRRALINDLSSRHKTYTWQDASFQEYGYGATQVTIK